ncbi:SGNH/GDSL hydrolase family protein [Xanthomonas sp. XNM01]|uniref:SGNH/GDSL hydrolase family protein n=1 Tax=Xanthomonas sp. XNM01 TaxID=2769289 RepID=UPI001785EF5B|nr:SGNH/GDSL hydrolase family protein [Xanthomonas sp. XNM01]MBD9367275.1 hypothetical protein [Xanthomonas sp. XNM01]
MPGLRSFRLRCGLLGLLACVAAPLAATPPPDAPAPPVPPAGVVSSPDWEQDMRRFAAEDAAQPPPRGAVLFVGSSSIRMWDTLAADFPDTAVINRGFGGSEIRDSTWYADRIVIPYAPRLIVLYAGDNDLNSGRTPQQLRADFAAFVERVRRGLPGVRIAYIAIKPSPARAGLMPAAHAANAQIRAEAARWHGVDFIDIYTPMLDGNGQPRAELFLEDQLHLNADGYALWRGIVAPYLAR